MKKRTSSMSRRIVSLLMSMVLTLTLVTPAAFAAEVVDGSGTTIVEGNTNPDDVNTSGDTEGDNSENKNTEDGKDEQPTEPGDEDKNPGEGEGDDANKPDEDKKDEAPDGENKDEENKDEQNAEEPSDGIDTQESENTNEVDTVVPWDGTIAEKFAGGDGSKDDPYQISNGAELAYLAQQVNGGTTYAGSFFTLTADIQLNEQDVPTANENPNSWTPIGNNKEKFQGTFDGDGHAVSGLYIKEDGTVSSSAYKGLFGNNTGTIQNLVVTGNVYVKSKKNSLLSVAGIAGKNNGTVQNCGFYGTVTAKKTNKGVESDSTSSNGGVVGSGKALNCWYYRTGENATELGVCGKKMVLPTVTKMYLRLSARKETMRRA